MKKFQRLRIFTAVSGVLLSSTANAHFQMMIPSTDMVENADQANVELIIKFSHPMEGHGMDMDTPIQFGVREHDKNVNLNADLRPMNWVDSLGNTKKGFKATYTIKRPGDYEFYLEPKPYWEPSEEQYIQQSCKVVVDGMDRQEGWGDPVGLKAEIVPLTRPYGLYTGNVFRGITMLNGKVSPHTDVEVEYYNEHGHIKAPTDAMITQVVRSDINGVFAYGIPRAGWWGFSSLHTINGKMKHNGKPVPIEVDGVLFVRAQDFPK
jgi:cobalt/nickel transport protein